MTGRPGQTKPLAGKEKEKEENVLKGKTFGHRRRRKTEKEREEKILRRKIYGPQRRRDTEKEKEENIQRRKRRKIFREAKSDDGQIYKCTNRYTSCGLK